jgi:hypothetical protein
MVKYTDITLKHLCPKLTITEIMAIEKCGLLSGQHTVAIS